MRFTLAPLAVNPGALRHRVTIERATRTPDAYGGAVETWAPVATVWAAVEPLQGREALLGMQLQASVTHRVRMRYREGVTSAMRLRMGERLFEVRSALDAGERRRELVLLAEEQT